jgi:uncharacterized membrane protein YfcA
MEYIIVAIAVLIGASLTFFSGFGLGTIMLPVFALFFDIEVAVGATAIVHLANNVFKFLLVRKFIHLQTFLQFGIPAMIAAIAGSTLLTLITDSEAIHTYLISGKEFEITWMKIVVGALMIFFAWFDLSPKYSDLKVDAKHLPLGGLLSGFFGGISGHQGAFRAAFLAKSGLDKKQFVGTSNAISLVIDLSRIPVYLGFISLGASKELDLAASLSEGKMLLIIGIVFAFVGTFVGKQLIEKTTIVGVQRLVGVLLFLMGGLMIAGIL